VTTPSASGGDAFVALLEQHRKIVAKVAGAYTRSAADRDDLTAEILAALWKSFPRYDARFPFATWAYRVALNVAISFLRAERRRFEHQTPTDFALVDAPVVDTLDPRVAELRAFIASLGEIDRALMLLSLDGYSYAEIATTVGLSETNVATKLQRLRGRARAALTATAPQGEPHGT
jgi:RNA polymerase sigma-70 factor (ECF subfamily)